MKKFMIPCIFHGGIRSPFAIYIGSPKDDHHPLQFQADWLQKERGGAIPQEVMDSISKLKALADKNNVSFEDLCVYALGVAQNAADEEKATSDDDDDKKEDSEDTDDTKDDNKDSSEDDSDTKDDESTDGDNTSEKE